MSKYLNDHPDDGRKTVYRWKWPWDRIYSDGGIIRWAYLPQPPKKQEDATHGTVEPQC